MEARPARLVQCHTPQLLDVVGIGPDAAVALLITVGDNPERLDGEASLAALCGVSPVERSSGRRQFRRLDRGGDRQANAVLHRIVFTRLRVGSTRAPRTTASAGSRRARPDARWSDASNGTSPERAFTRSSPSLHTPRHGGGCEMWERESGE
ncbi:transposase [Streptomyces sp. NPDC001833]|uniref:transposase n=1 Tax=Streptomyces sp. NPDC001833 TaxID=3154658 RepID=UPI00332B8305